MSTLEWMAEREMRHSQGERDSPIRGVLVDLDGVLYVGDTALPGAIDAVRRLRAGGIALRFVTNASTKPVSAVEEKLDGLGVETGPGEVISAVRAGVLTLRRLNARAPYLIVDEGVAGEFSSFSPVGLFPANPTRQPDFIVVGDIGKRWSYKLMNTLFGLLNGGAKLLALHKGRAWQTDEGLSIDIGAFVAGLEYASGIEAIVTGKPAEGFFHAALDDMGIGAGAAIMVGDDIDSDVGGAQAAGIRGVLVKTGKYRSEYAERSPVVPWRILDSFAQVDSLPELEL